MRIIILSVFLAVILIGCTQQSGQLIVGNNSTSYINYTNQTLSNAQTEPVNNSANISPPQQNSSLIINPISNCSNQTLPIVYYYYSSRCSACKDVRPLIDYAKKDYENYTCFVENDVLTKEGIAAYNKFAEDHKLNATSRYVPVIEIGNKTLTGLQQINYTSLYNLLSVYTNHVVLDENYPH